MLLMMLKAVKLIFSLVGSVDEGETVAVDEIWDVPSVRECGDEYQHHRERGGRGITIPQRIRRGKTRMGSEEIENCLGQGDENEKPME
jgi:hypothetical protein